jgi:hypothetical protein
MELRDTTDVVYFKRNPQADDDYGIPDGRTADIYDLQKRMEADPECGIELILVIK